VFAYCSGQGEKVHLFVGRTDGTIVDSRGDRNFGWDPIFQPEGYDLTYAEMDDGAKNKVSHRYRAIAKLQQYLDDLKD